MFVEVTISANRAIASVALTRASSLVLEFVTKSIKIGCSQLCVLMGYQLKYSSKLGTTLNKLSQ